MICRAFLVLLLLAGCGSDYEAPSREDCERAGGLLLAQYKSESICIRRESLIDQRDLHPELPEQRDVDLSESERILRQSRGRR